MMWTSSPWVAGASLREAPYETPLPNSRSQPSMSRRRQVTPDGEDDRPRPQDVAAVEVHLLRRRVDPLDRPGHEDLGAEPPGLLQRAARELVARHARREAEVVLDAGRRPGLAAGRLSLDHDRPQALRRAVHGRGEAGGAGADDDRVVVRRGRLRAEAEQLGHAPQLRPRHRPAVDEADDREVAVARKRPAPALRGVGLLRLHPGERDLVAVEEVPQLRAGGVPAMPDDGGPGRRRVGGDALEAARAGHPVAREPADLEADRRRHRGDRVVVVRLEPQDARRLGRAEPDREHRPEHDRHLAEHVAGMRARRRCARSRRRA